MTSKCQCSTIKKTALSWLHALFFHRSLQYVAHNWWIVSLIHSLQEINSCLIWYANLCNKSQRPILCWRHAPDKGSQYGWLTGRFMLHLICWSHAKFAWQRIAVPWMACGMIHVAFDLPDIWQTQQLSLTYQVCLTEDLSAMDGLRDDSCCIWLQKTCQTMQLPCTYQVTRQGSQYHGWLAGWFIM